MAVAASLLMSTVTAKAQYIWAAASNETLYNEMLSYLKTFQTDLVGEQAYYMAQNLVVELEAAHKSDPYIWMTQMHNFCNKLEAIYPPSLSHPKVSRAYEDRYDKLRRGITRLRDFPMHEVTISYETPPPASGQAEAFTAANRQWLHNKREEFFRSLRGPRPSADELQIAKLYSSGVVLRTKDACIGIDICYGEGLYDALYKEELADMLDVLYVTHAHGDHYDLELFRMMMARGKPVVGPFTMEERYFSKDVGDKHFWRDSQLEPQLIGGVATTQAYMSGQGDEPCLLYLIQIGDWRIVHVGDNSHHENEELIYPLFPKADVVFAPVFQGVVYLFNSTLAAPNPGNIEQVYVNIHENEWHHEIHGRISYEYLYNHNGALNNTGRKYPSVVIMDNGEHITLYK
ncbi:MAG: MBL fold metallo-hydrolase [Bacteroidales bacterium]|nr:MBL fold metallo-hydrolase [Bacteroidales bacterium]